MLFRSNPKKTKLTAQYYGPHLVLRENDPDYLIEVKGRKKWLHGDNLKRFLTCRELDIIDLNLENPRDEDSSNVRQEV